MEIRIHAITAGELEAIKVFLFSAIEFQQHGSIIIDDRDSSVTDEDFIECYGFTKEECRRGVESFKQSMKRFRD